MSTLKRVEIRGYRSIRSTELELGPLNVLIGANGAGKSNFISFFKMLNEMMMQRLQQFVGRTGRAHSILHFGPKITAHVEGNLEFDEDDKRYAYCFRLENAADGALVFSDEAIRQSSATESAPHVLDFGAGHREAAIAEDVHKGSLPWNLYHDALSQCKVYHFHDTSPTARSRSFSYLRDNCGLMQDAGNLAAMLYAYRESSPHTYRRLVRTLKKLLPDFGDFDLQPDRINPNDVGLTWRMRGREEYLLGPHQLSDGSLRAISILTLLLQPTKELPNVIVLDEPELGLHPHALEIIAGLMRAVSTKAQVIVATQSQSFVNHFSPQEIIVVDSAAGESTLRRLDPDQLTEWLEDFSLGELWERNVIGGGPLP